LPGRPNEAWDELDRYARENWRTCNASGNTVAKPGNFGNCLPMRKKDTSKDRAIIKPTLMLVQDSPQELLKRVRGRFHHSQLVRFAASMSTSS
jgi:hypothetical protein